MAKGGKKSKRPHKHCAIYFSQRRRIKNKTKKLEKRIKKFNFQLQEKIRLNCPIGRKREKREETKGGLYA